MARMRRQPRGRAPGGAVAREVVVPRLERFLARSLERRGVHHAVVGAASLDDAWTWSDAGGVASPDGVPMQPDTPWFLASVTKLYIAAVVLRLHEKGLIDLEAPIAASLPPRLGSGLHVLEGVDHTARLTAVHLLGHLSGLPDSLDERPPGGRSLVEEIVEDGDREWTLEEAVGRARDRLTPHFPPSDPEARRPRIRYSETNYQLLMLMARHVSGRPMAHLHRELLLEPLHLHHTWLPGDRPAAPGREPATVWLGDAALVDRSRALRSVGDLYGTVDDVLRFGRALFTGTLFDDAATAALMQRRFNRFGIPRSMASLRAPSWPIEYGLGMMRFELSRLLAGGRRIPGVVGHTGSTGSWLWHCPQLALLIAGTLDQATAATVPFRALPRTLAGLPG